MKKNVLMLVLLILFSNVVSANEDWKWSIELYAMAANMTGTAGLGRVTGADVDVDTQAILDKLQIGAMLHTEALHSNGWGVMFDYSFMRLGDDITGSRGGLLEATVRQGVFEGFVFNRRNYDNDVLDIYGGIRWWDNDFDVDIDLAILPGSPSIDIEEDWIDLVVGARYFHPVNEKWFFSIQADIGGFGVSSDLTASASAAVIYQLTGSTKIDIKYKGLWADYESGISGQPGYFNYDVTTHGPIIGLIFEF